MGFVKTKDELDKFFGLGVRKFIGAKMMGLMFGADADITAGLLPPPLEQADMPGGLIFIAEYPDDRLLFHQASPESVRSTISHDQYRIACVPYRVYQVVEDAAALSHP